MTQQRWEVLFAATAEEQARTIADWWEVERPANPGLFFDELVDAIDRLSDFPGTGASVDSTVLEGVKRILLPGSRYHVYYTMEADRREVLIRAIWHGSRGQLPELG